MNKLQKYDQIKKIAVEHYATNPNLTVKELSMELGIAERTIVKWRTDPNFHDAIYDRYMVLFGGELPSVLNAMLREGKSGNVQAARLVLEHSGKLVKNVNVTIDSPYEKFLKSEKAEFEVVDAEIEDIVESIPDIDVDLPERVVEDQRKRVVKEKKKLMTAKQKEERKRKRRDWYKWNARAEKAGVDPLPARRPTPAQRQAWEKQITDYEQKTKENE